jgi:transposase
MIVIGAGRETEMIADPKRKPHQDDGDSDTRRRQEEALFNRLKDFRRIATRYDRLARNHLASVCLAAALVWWI